MFIQRLDYREECEIDRYILVSLTDIPSGLRYSKCGNYIYIYIHKWMVYTYIHTYIIYASPDSPDSPGSLCMFTCVMMMMRAVAVRKALNIVNEKNLNNRSPEPIIPMYIGLSELSGLSYV